jgi:excinuclease ABC subunit A
LSQEALNIAFYGTGDKEFDVKWNYKTKTDSGVHRFVGKWIGFEGLLLEEYYRRQANGKGSELMPFLSYKTCEICNGQRLKPELLAVKFYNKNIHELSTLSFNQLIEFFESVDKTEQTKQVVENILEQIINLKNFNLGHLHLDRKSNSLSGGELQRVMLSSQLKGSLTGLCYILDEPSSGLHPHDVKTIIKNIKALVEKGNTLITVEHQKEIIESADNIIALGPDSGENGGEIISIETEIKNEPKVNIEVKTELEEYFSIYGANANNLKNIDVSFLQNTLNVVTGTSGSGKTSLMQDVLIKSQQNATNCDSTNGLDNFNNIVWIDRHSMSKSVISSLASYLNILDDVKKVFSPDLKGSKIKLAQLSYNNKQGQCPDCKGQGFIKTKMDFLNDLISICETCKGKRYRPEVLEIKHREKNISEVLEMSVEEATIFFSGEKKIFEKLNLLRSLGLSYLKLGQNSHEFSGGEAQRIKIAKVLLSNLGEKNLYVFDEASRGLHKSDLKFLLRMYSQILKLGHTIIAIEHNPLIIKEAQYIVDLHNGEITYQGNLKDIKGTLIEQYL